VRNNHRWKVEIKKILKKERERVGETANTGQWGEKSAQ
jgi:hypothetical protein